MKSTQVFSVGDLVDAAYELATHLTRNRQVTAVVATKILQHWLEHSDHPELVRSLQGAASRG
jgi:hypothetical protein